MSLQNWIKIRLKTTKGLTQAGLAEHLGVAPSAVSRMLNGERKIKVDELPVIESYLGARYVPENLGPPVNINDNRQAEDLIYEQKDGTGGLYGFAEAPAKPLYRSAEDASDYVPVYGYAAGSVESGLNLVNGDISDWVPRHPAQRNLIHAFAVRTLSDSMEPRYYRNELIYVHPGRYPDCGQDCVVEMKNGDAYVKQYMGETATHIRFGQHNPKSKFSWPKTGIKKIYAVIGRG